MALRKSTEATNGNGSANGSAKRAKRGEPSELQRLSSDPAVRFMPEIEFEWVMAELIGVTPLVESRFREAAKRQMEIKEQGLAREKKAPRKPEQEFLESCHVCSGDYDLAKLTKNLYGFPAVGIKKAMASALFRFGEAANKVNTLCTVSVHGPYAGLVALNADPPKMRRDVIPQTGKNAGKAALAYRPSFFPWSMEVPIRYYADAISLDQILHALYLAGELIGLGSWRRERGGEMGMFSLGKITRLPADYKRENFGTL